MQIAHTIISVLLVVVAACAVLPAAHAQTLEPRSNTNTPVGIKSVVAGLGCMTGDVVSSDSYVGHKQREQDPVYSLQGRLLYCFRNGTWLALNASGCHGGRTTIDGVESDDLQRNSRLGVTLTKPVNRRHSFKVTVSTGTTTRIGGDFDAIAMLWQYRWGGGL